MNSLSWLLYAADASGNLGALLCILSLGLAVGYCGAFVGRCMTADVNGTTMPTFRVRYLAVAALVGVLSCAMPSRNTVYMIAASEAGERIATTPEAREMFDLVRSRVKEALADTPKK